MVFNRRGDIFDEMDREFGEMDRLMDRMLSSMRQWDWTNVPADQPVYYGVSVNVGPDGVPRVAHFGNVHPGAQGLIEAGVREPFVTSFLDEEKNQVRVTAEMPGVDKTSLKVEALDNALTIKAEGKDRKYEKTLHLATPVDPDSAKASYNNGVLEVTLALKAPVKPKGKAVKID